MNGGGRFLLHTAQIAVAAVGIVAVDPFLEIQLPEAPDGVRYALSALGAAAVLELIRTFIAGRPILRFEWRLAANPEVVERLDLKASVLQPDSEQYELKLHCEARSLAASWILMAAARQDVRILVTTRQAPIIPTVERSSFEGSDEACSFDAAANGVIISMLTPPRRSGEWHTATLSWEVRDVSMKSETNVEYEIQHAKPLMRLVFRVLIRRLSQVKTVSVVRK
jgi:hypothetical protein